MSNPITIYNGGSSSSGMNVESFCLYLYANFAIVCDLNQLASWAIPMHNIIWQLNIKHMSLSRKEYKAYVQTLYEHEETPDFICIVKDIILSPYPFKICSLTSKYSPIMEVNICLLP